jgi:Na+-transporting methylmalonyl-CoA/oxaloacetate decarboxylase gamma subunit
MVRLAFCFVFLFFEVFVVPYMSRVAHSQRRLFVGEIHAPGYDSPARIVTPVKV